MNRTLHQFAVGTTAVSFLLIIAGGLVTSTGSGLAVPDWPLSYGTLFPPMIGGIRFEHSHRVIASLVGFLTLILSLWVLATEKRKNVRRLVLCAFGLIVLQGLLGGLTVMLQLPPPISAGHACLGQLFFSTILLFSVVTSEEWRTHEARGYPRTFRISSLVTTGLIFLQLVLGATLRHTQWTVPLLLGHIGCACAVILSIMKTTGLILNDEKSHPMHGLARQLTQLLIIQVGLGGATLLRVGQPWIATAHVAVGALLLAISFLLTVHVWRTRKFYFSDYLELTKPRLTFLAVLTSFVGFLLGSVGKMDPVKLVLTLFGTVMLGAGSGILNQYLERKIDGSMKRTKKRPLPSGRVSPTAALQGGIFCSLVGLFVMHSIHPLTGLLAAATLISYLFIYTPLKKQTPLCTLIGAIPGAIPPLLGWVAGRGRFGLEGWLLFAILFIWQLPHFLAIAWTYREDYASANFKMLPVLDPDGGTTSRQIVLYSAALLFVSLLPTFFGLTGPVYFLWALVSGIAFLCAGLATAFFRSDESARRLFVASILYLPGILFIMTVDRLIL